MRVGDPAAPVLPAADGDRSRVAQHLRIALERVPGPAFAYDDPDEESIVYDSADETLVWDSPDVGSGFSDAVCDFHSVTIEAGAPDEDGLVESAEAVITLDNRTGAWSQRDSTGRLTYYAIGRRVQLLGELADGTLWWLFAGRVTAWDEQTDGTVTITAHDGFAQLAQDSGTTWTPGTAAQTVAQRITAICTAWSYTDPRDLETTSTLLGNPPTKRSPLEEMQVCALSDGGWLFCDQDGDLTYRGRTWTTGRADQTTIPTVSDNVCDAVGVWDLVLIGDDVGVASSVRLENYETPAKVATASLAPGPWDRPYVVTHADPDLWNVQVDGNALATDLLARSRNDAPRFTWTWYLHAPDRDIWSYGIDRRLGDRVNLVRTQPAAGGETQWLDVDLLVTTIRHEITPEEWLVSVETGRVVAYRYPELWDRTPYTWDQDDPLAIWRL